MMSLKDLKEHHYTKQGGTPCINQRSRDVSPRDAVRGKVIIISTGQRATGQGVTFGFGLTPALSCQRERGKYWILPALGGIPAEGDPLVRGGSLASERRTRHEKLPEFSLHGKSNDLYGRFLAGQNWRMSSLTSLAAAMADCWVGS